MEGETSTERREAVLSWALAVGCGAAMLCWGFLIFFTVGDKGPPPWDYSIVEDVPGEAPYSIYGTGAFHGFSHPVVGAKVEEQHVMGPAEEPPAPLPKGSR